MGCKFSKTVPINKEEEIKNEQPRKNPQYHRPEDENVELQKLSHDHAKKSQHSITTEIYQNEDTVSEESAIVDEFVDIVVADPDAFNHAFIQQRKQAIKNTSYRSVIESWNPNSLQQLAESIKAFSNGKNLVDRHWIIFYWITFNIEYDTVSYFSKNYEDQSAEGVFRTRKGVCAGYANIYKYLCDHIEIPSEIVSGFAKGYGFDDREGAPTETDHAWNVVQIYHHRYLVESTWGAGHLNDNKQFKCELKPYYFLARRNEMIYDHLPKDNKWQLLQTPVKMRQYMQMPKLRPKFFDLNLELISPFHQAHVSLVCDKSYALVLIRTPTNVELLASLKLDGKEIEGGHRVRFHAKKQVHRCYFAPASIGKHKIHIFARKRSSNARSYEGVADFTLNVNELPDQLVSYPTTYEAFSDLRLKVISPVKTHLIKVCNEATHACVIIQAPDDVDLSGRLEDSEEKKIEYGNQVYYDQRKCLWKCKFAPNRDGLFKATIFGKNKSDSGNYSAAVSFKIQATQISSPPLSYPHTWQIFHDLNLKVKAPKNCSTVPWPENVSYVEILMQTPDDVRLSCRIHYNNINVEDGAFAQFDNNKRLWQLLFAPARIGQHELIVFAKQDSKEKSGCVVEFCLNVTQLYRPMKFPTVYDKSHTMKGQIYEPLNGILKKGATVPIHCVIPGATDVLLTVDSKWLKSEGYTDPLLKRNVTVGTKDVTIYAKFGQNSSYEGLVKYYVQ